MNLKMILYLITLIAFILSGCSNPVDIQAGGSGLEDGNASISGVIKNKSGDPLSKVSVQLFEHTYNAYTDDSTKKMTTSSDSLGIYWFKNLKPNNYNIQAKHSSDSTIGLIRGIIIDSTMDSTLNTNPLILENPGTISISTKELQLSTGNYVNLPGTDVFEIIDSTELISEIIIISNVPVSKYSEIQFHSSIFPTQNLLMEEIEILEFEIEIINVYNDWSFTNKVTINTSPTGGNITTNVTQFPLLVRLDKGNFNFTQSVSQGQDIRFSDQNFNPLPYDIERWDSQLEEAEIWVLIDTLLPNNDSQFIHLHSGKMGVGELGSDSAVFNDDSEFEFSYHMNIDPATEPYGQDNGGMNDSNIKEAIVGWGTYFYLNQYITPSSPAASIYHNSLTEFTFDSWIRVDSSTGEVHKVLFEFGGSDNGFALGYNSETELFFFSTMQNGLDIRILTTTPVQAETELIYLSVSYEAGAMKIFLNGILEGTGSNGTNIPPSVDGPGLGGVGDQSVSLDTTATTLVGLYDELRFSKTSRSEDWIRLSYENQVQNSTIVMIK